MHAYIHQQLMSYGKKDEDEEEERKGYLIGAMQRVVAMGAGVEAGHGEKNGTRLELRFRWK